MNQIKANRKYINDNLTRCYRVISGHFFKCIFRCITNRAGPVVRQLLKGDPFLSLIIFISANCTSPHISHTSSVKIIGLNKCMYNACLPVGRSAFFGLFAFFNYTLFLQHKPVIHATAERIFWVNSYLSSSLTYLT